MIVDNADAVFLLQRDFVTINRGQHIIRFFLEGTMQKENSMLWVKILIGCQVSRDSGRGLPNHSDTTESSATLQTVKALWKRFFSLLFIEVSL